MRSRTPEYHETQKKTLESLRDRNDIQCNESLRGNRRVHAAQISWARFGTKLHITTVLPLPEVEAGRSHPPARWQNGRTETSWQRRNDKGPRSERDGGRKGFGGRAGVKLYKKRRLTFCLQAARAFLCPSWALCRDTLFLSMSLSTQPTFLPFPFHAYRFAFSLFVFPNLHTPISFPFEDIYPCQHTNARIQGTKLALPLDPARPCPDSPWKVKSCRSVRQSFSSFPFHALVRVYPRSRSFSCPPWYPFLLLFSFTPASGPLCNKSKIKNNVQVIVT